MDRGPSYLNVVRRNNGRTEDGRTWLQLMCCALAQNGVLFRRDEITEDGDRVEIGIKSWRRLIRL